jgi:DNA-binding transcriptional LysR family regulator
MIPSMIRHKCMLMHRSIYFIYMNMNLHHLAIFHAIADSGSLTVAAKRMHISQPAISRQLKWFENRLGVVLFERLPRGMRLTHAGEILRNYAARIFDMERAAAAAMRDIAHVDRGELPIAASNTMGTYLLPTWLVEFRLRYPRIAVSVFVGNTEQVAAGVADWRFAFGFIEGPLHDDTLKVERLMQDEIVPVAAADAGFMTGRRLQAKALATLPVLAREPGSGTRELVMTLLASLAIVPTNVLCLGNTEALKRAAVRGGGIAWLPRVCMEEELSSGALVPLQWPNLSIRRPLNIVSHAGAYVSPAAKAFLDLVRAAVKT